MNYIWSNGWRLASNWQSGSYARLKTLIYKGDKPFVVPRSQLLTVSNAVRIAPLVPPALATSDTLASLMHDRALAFLESPKEKYVWWSGGLDSTAILSELFKHPDFVKQLRNGQAKLVYNQTSIDEYKHFHETYLVGYPHLVSSMEYYSLPGVLHADGCWADELFGTYQAEHYKGSWQEVYLNRYREEAELFLCWAQPELDKAPGKDNFSQLWWLEYLLAYQDAMLRPYYQTNVQCTKQLATDYLNTSWFGAAVWHNWAFSRQIGYATYKESKQELRDFIFEFTKDADYRENKSKVYSQGTLYRGWHTAISSAYHRI